MKGKLKNSDLAGDISVGVSALMEEIGADNAHEVISVFDDLEKRGQFKLDEIAGVLGSGRRQFGEEDMAGIDRSRPASTSQRGEPVRPAAGKIAHVAATELQLKFTDGTESFCTLDAISGKAVLARDVNTVDGRLFIKAGIDVTPLIASILIYLDSLGVLGLEKRGDAEYSGIYVRVVGARPDDKTEPEGEAADDTKTISISGGNSKTVSVNEVLPGSILAHDVYTTDGRSYLPAGADLTPRITTLLRDLYELGTISSEVRIVD